MAQRRVFTRGDELAFLKEATGWRHACIAVLTRAKQQGPLYKATESIMEAIDGLAEVVAGDRPASISATPPRQALNCRP